MSTRRIRAFKRWMASNAIHHSPSISIIDTSDEGIWVLALRPLADGDLVATIPKSACITARTSAAKDLIEAAGIGGVMALAVAVMYERGLGERSKWDGYFQVLPEREMLPLAWEDEEVHRLLRGTELHKVVEEDKILAYEDWKENILPLMQSEDLKIDLSFFSFDQYIAARTLVASRSFQIDDYHGFGMVPLADLFNHKTGAEDVHFTSICSFSSSDDDDDAGDNHEDMITDDKSSISDLNENSADDDPTKLEMIIVKDVEAGAEIFNTYGSMANAALLHRYGFTEPDNEFDIVNIDMDLVHQCCVATYSSRHFRRRLSLWRILKYSGCISGKTEYFEITFDGEPQFELITLLIIVFLSEEECEKLDHAVARLEDITDVASLILSIKFTKNKLLKMQEDMEDLFLTKNVRNALANLADDRERLYGSAFEDDYFALQNCCCVNEKKLYHSLVLRVSERMILQKLRSFAKSGAVVAHLKS